MTTSSFDSALVTVTSTDEGILVRYSESLADEAQWQAITEWAFEQEGLTEDDIVFAGELTTSPSGEGVQEFFPWSDAHEAIQKALREGYDDGRTRCDESVQENDGDLPDEVTERDFETWDDAYLKEERVAEEHSEAVGTAYLEGLVEGFNDRLAQLRAD